VLAAGQATRFGGPKLLADFRGRPLLSHPLGVLAEARRAGLISKVVVVLPAGGQELAALSQDLGAEPVHHTDPLPSLSSSVRLGLRAATGYDAALLVLGDQPLLRIDAVEHILHAAGRYPDAVVRASYASDPAVPGHPVVVPARWWHLAESDQGFRTVAHLGVPMVDVPMAGDNPDVDTPEDLGSLRDRPD